MLQDVSEGPGHWEKRERLRAERWEGNLAEMHKGVVKRLDFSLGPLSPVLDHTPKGQCPGMPHGSVSEISSFESSVLLLSVCSPVLCYQLMGLWQSLLFSWLTIYGGHHLRII